jgi:hypothetical protein
LPNALNTAQVITIASEHLLTLSGHIFDLLTVTKPVTPDAAVNLSKVVSKLSPLLGNLIEFNSVEFLNDRDEFKGRGEWERQDPGFPDTVFRGVTPTPGFEIKAWFPLATEITARFKDSQNHFADGNTYVCMLAWLPEHIIYGKPYILDVVVVSGASVAQARDVHYHNPPDYLVLEPEDTKARTRNLQQTNTNGYKLQTTDDSELAEAARIVQSWGAGGRDYKPTADYQHRLRELRGRFNYRLDTNYAKMDRIVHAELEAFKTRVMGTVVHGLSVRDWDRLFRSADRARTALLKAQEADDAARVVRAEAQLVAAEANIKEVLMQRLGITEGDPDSLLE